MKQVLSDADSSFCPVFSALDRENKNAILKGKAYIQAS